MIIESWIVVITFMVFAIYVFIMNFASSYFKDWLSSKWGGRWVNFFWMILLIIIFGILTVFNVECTISGQCRHMSITVTALAVSLTLLIIGIGVYHSITYKKKEKNSDTYL